MAITYHASRRIQGLAYVTQTATLTNAEDSGSWTGSGSLSITSGELQVRLGGSNAGVAQRDITSVDSSSWVMRWKWEQTGTQTIASPNDMRCMIGLASNSGSFGGNSPTYGSTSGDHIGMYMDVGHIHFVAFNGTTPSAQSTSSSMINFTGAPFTKYCEIIRDGSSFTLNIFDSSTFTGTKLTRSLTYSGMTSLRYIGGQAGWYGGGGGIQANMSEITFYDGITSATPTGDAKPVKTAHRAGTNNGTIFANWDYILYGGSAEFDGSNDNIKFGDNTDWNFMHNSGSWTASFWMKPDVLSDRMVFNTNGTTNTNIGVQCIITSSNALRTRIGNGSGDWVTVTHGSFSVNTWYFVVITFDGTTLSVKSSPYQGSLSSATTGTASGSASSANSLSPMTLGSASDNNTTYPFDGHINVFMIWDRVLTSAEINTLYSGGTGSTSYSENGLKLRTCLQITGEPLQWFDNQVGITDIQTGSRFEETDTRKMYHYTYDWFLEGTTIPPQPSTRGLFAGGEVSTDTIDCITIATAGNATDFGNLTAGRYNASAVSSGTRAVFMGGNDGTYSNTMDYVTVATTGNATDFGNLTVAIQSGAGVSDETRGVTGGGTTGSVSSVIQYITIATTGIATTFGVNLTQARHSPSGVSSYTRGVWMGGFGSGNVSTMDYITIATTGTCSNFGNLLASRRAAAGCASPTRGLIGGGYEGSHVSTIEFITIDADPTVTATDFGDLTRSNNVLGACSSATRGVWGGGNNTNVNTIDYVTIDANPTVTATDFGDLTAGRAGVVGTDGY